MPNRPRRSYNPKRALAEMPAEEELIALAQRVYYGGNPEHKRNPGDFGLTPPSSPRPDKTLCDLAGITSKSQALSALRSGVLKGLISKKRGDFPQNIWSVSEEGIPSRLSSTMSNQAVITVTQCLRPIHSVMSSFKPGKDVDE
jgi:hypothetical protein